MSDPSMPRTPADIARAMRESLTLRPRTMEERERSAVGAALSVHLCADPTLLERGAATPARWIAEQGTSVPPSLRDWQVLCLAGDMDSVLSVLHVWTEYADAMRASHPFVDILNETEMAAIQARVRAEKSPPQIPLAVWTEIARIVDTYFSPVELLAMAMYPQPLLTDASGREHTVVEMLEAGNYEPV